MKNFKILIVLLTFIFVSCNTDQIADSTPELTLEENLQKSDAFEDVNIEANGISTIYQDVEYIPGNTYRLTFTNGIQFNAVYKRGRLFTRISPSRGLAQYRVDRNGIAKFIGYTSRSAAPTSNTWYQIGDKVYFHKFADGFGTNIWFFFPDGTSSGNTKDLMYTFLGSDNAPDPLFTRPATDEEKKEILKFSRVIP